MNCPHCSTELKVAERKNVEIDYCSSCRGIWLDKGELDKIVSRTKASSAEAKNPKPSPTGQNQSPGAETGGWLSDLLDVFLT